MKNNKAGEEIMFSFQNGYDNGKYETIQKLLKLDMINISWHSKEIEFELQSIIGQGDMPTEDDLICIIKDIISK